MLLTLLLYGWQYCQDLEKPENGGIPAAAEAFKAQLVAADGILITCPEYNGGITPVLLNAITWATRGEGEGETEGEAATLTSCCCCYVIRQ